MAYSDEELVLWMKLCRVRGLGPKRIMRLFEIFGSLKDIQAASEDRLQKTRIFSPAMLDDWVRLKSASSENFYSKLEECKNFGIDILLLIDADYPLRLKQVPYPPRTLYLKGDASLLHTNTVAVVGSRQSDENARIWAFNGARALAEQGLTVVSGGAEGIDFSAHSGALSVPNGKTICVLGSGIGTPFPEKHKALFDEVSNRGLLVSEHLPSFSGTAISLVQRNRITSGISNALIVVASKTDGGAMNQVKTAYEQGVPIFCPHISKGFVPSEGLRFSVDTLSAREIGACIEVLPYLEERPFSVGLQKKLA